MGQGMSDGRCFRCQGLISINHSQHCASFCSSHSPFAISVITESMEHRSSLELPVVVLNNICLQLRLDNAQGALLNVLLTSKAAYEIAAPHLYRDVYIDPTTLPSLLRGLRIPPPTTSGDSPLSRFPWEKDEAAETAMMDKKPEEQKMKILEYLDSIGGSEASQRTVPVCRKNADCIGSKVAHP